MSSIPVLTTNVKTSTSKNARLCKRRKHASHVLQVLPYYATHTQAPTLAELQQEGVKMVARLLAGYFTTREGVSDDAHRG